MRPLAALVLAALALPVLTPTVAEARLRAKHARRSAKQAPSGETRFLGKDPHGPLAVVRHGVLAQPADSACRTWARRGEAWQSVGRLGEITGRARVVALERYDVTNCDESTLLPGPGRRGTGLFVQGRYQPLAITAWSPAPEDLRALAALVAARDATLRSPPPYVKEHTDLPLAKRLLGYRTPDGTRRLVVGGRALSILRLDAGGWVVEHVAHAMKDEQPAVDRFMPLAVLDMDGDGVPEIVVHHDCYEWFSDSTFHWANGAWKDVDAGIYGSTA